MNQSNATYALAAPQYAEVGQVPIPIVVDESNRRPAVLQWSKLHPNCHKVLSPKFPNHNIGILLGKVAVVDIDDGDPALEAMCRERFGNTPLKASTPGQGRQHWFYASEGVSRQIGFEGLKLDILGQGFAQVWPSKRPHGAYEFIEGGLADFRRLPKIKGLAQGRNCSQPRSSLPERGQRNDWLFVEIKECAAKCESKNELQFLAEQLNESLAEPLSKPEVRGRVESAWRYKMEDKLLLRGCEPTAMIPISMWEELTSSEMHVFMGLKYRHGAKQGAPFVLAQATADSFGMSINTFRKVQWSLAEKEYLAIVRAGEAGSRKPTIARLLK